MATMDRWIVFCSGKLYIEDICRAKDEELSIMSALDQVRFPIVAYVMAQFSSFIFPRSLH